jgi:formylmethanofuran--tetrahydromethanopterin N-formyltransferase
VCRWTINATQAAMAASRETPDLVRISAGNHGGRLGENFIYLHPDKQPLLD